MAIISGSKAAIAAPTPAVLPHTKVIRFTLFAMPIDSSISDILTRRSEWLRRVPTAPADFTASANTCPVYAPETMESMCWLKTGMLVLSETGLMSVNWGATAMEIPCSLLTPSAILASSTAFFPVASWYVLKLTTIRGAFSSRIEPAPHRNPILGEPIVLARPSNSKTRSLFPKYVGTR